MREWCTPFSSAIDAGMDFAILHTLLWLLWQGNLHWLHNKCPSKTWWKKWLNFFSPPHNFGMFQTCMHILDGLTHTKLVRQVLQCTAYQFYGREKSTCTTDSPGTKMFRIFLFEVRCCGSTSEGRHASLKKCLVYRASQSECNYSTCMITAAEAKTTGETSLILPYISISYSLFRGWHLDLATSTWM